MAWSADLHRAADRPNVPLSKSGVEPGGLAATYEGLRASHGAGAAEPKPAKSKDDPRQFRPHNTLETCTKSERGRAAVDVYSKLSRASRASAQIALAATVVRCLAWSGERKPVPPRSHLLPRSVHIETIFNLGQVWVRVA
jgi:hypothetical protein